MLSEPELVIAESELVCTIWSSLAKGLKSSDCCHITMLVSWCQLSFASRKLLFHRNFRLESFIDKYFIFGIKTNITNEPYDRSKPLN